MENDIAICIQVRSQSKRLKNKCYKKINGKSILELTLERSKLLGKRLPIFVLTSTKKSDDKIETFCKKKKIKIFRGEHKNVYGRYLGFLKKNNYQNIVRVTADNIFTDINEARKLIKLHLKKKFHYSSNHSGYLPRGMGIDIFNSYKLIQLKKSILTKYNREHISSFFIKNKNKYKTIIIKKKKINSNFNLSIDTINDYNFIKKNYFMLKKVRSYKEVKNLKLKY